MQAQEAGFSMLSVMFAVAITGMLALVSMQALSNSFLATSSVEVKGDLEATRQLIRRSIDCKETLKLVDPAVGCTKNIFVDLKRRNGKLLIASGNLEGVKVGKWIVRATCSGSSINIERYRPGGDPLTKQGKAWMPLFPGSTPPLCTDYFGGSSERNGTHVVGLRRYDDGTFVPPPERDGDAGWNNLYADPESPVGTCSVVSGFSNHEGAAWCDEDEVLVGGGVDCGSGLQLQSFPQTYRSKGKLKTVWIGRCCGKPGPGAVNPYALCQAKIGE